MKESETSWLRNHLGHNSKTHDEFYSQQLGAIEVVKIAKLLIDVKRREIYKYASISLDDITLDGKASSI